MAQQNRRLTTKTVWLSPEGFNVRYFELGDPVTACAIAAGLIPRGAAAGRAAPRVGARLAGIWRTRPVAVARGLHVASPT